MFKIMLNSLLTCGITLLVNQRDAVNPWPVPRGRGAGGQVVARMFKQGLRDKSYTAPGGEVLRESSPP